MFLLSEDAYKQIISPVIGDMFKNKCLVQCKDLTEEDIIKKMKGYTLNKEDKKIRIAKVKFFNLKLGLSHKLAVATKIDKTIEWDRVI